MATTMSTTTGRGRKATKVSTAAMSSARKALTIGAGCGIPIISLYTSHRAGESFLLGAPVYGYVFLLLCCTVLVLSLSHLATALADITHASWRDSMILAVVVDCLLVTIEIGNASGHKGGWLGYAVLVSITGASMLLNCWAFLNYKQAKRVR